jgi:hypothetical protein
MFSTTAFGRCRLQISASKPTILRSFTFSQPLQANARVVPEIRRALPSIFHPIIPSVDVTQPETRSVVIKIIHKISGRRKLIARGFEGPYRREEKLINYKTA